jgi:hypothetical protein
MGGAGAARELGEPGRAGEERGVDGGGQTMATGAAGRLAL